MRVVTDPLKEKKHEKLPGLIWKYDERVLLLMTRECPMNCVFCFRKHLYEDAFVRANDNEIVSFIHKNKQIKEFIFSGGEPLQEIKSILSLVNRLEKLKQITIYRIHTRLPILQPKRVSLYNLKKLIRLTQKPIYMALHINHPDELKSQYTRRLIISLRQAGFILLSHSVFLKGVNDSPIVLKRLFTLCIELGIKPYHIFHCDHMTHTKQFVVPLKKEAEIMTTLFRTLSGIALPIHVVDSHTGKGKIPVPTYYWDFDIASYRDFQKNNNLT